MRLIRCFVRRRVFCGWGRVCAGLLLFVHGVWVFFPLSLLTTSFLRPFFFSLLRLGIYLIPYLLQCYFSIVFSRLPVSHCLIACYSRSTSITVCYSLLFHIFGCGALPPRPPGFWLGGFDPHKRSFAAFDRGGQTGPPRSNALIFGAADDMGAADDRSPYVRQSPDNRKNSEFR